MAGGAIELKQFTWAKDDDFAAEHAAVWRYVEDAVASVGPGDWPRAVDPNSFPSGKVLLDAEPESARRLTVAAVRQVRFWEDQMQQVEDDNPSVRILHTLPGWGDVCGRMSKALALATALAERDLPFDEAELIELIEWLNSLEVLTSYFAPVEGVTRAAQRYANSNRISPELMELLRQFAKELLGAIDEKSNECGAAIERLLPDEEPVEEDEVNPLQIDRRPIVPAPAGNPGVLVRLKQYLHSSLSEAASQKENSSSGTHLDLPQAADRALLEELQSSVSQRPGWVYRQLNRTEIAKKIFGLDDFDRGRLLLAACERDIEWVLNPPEAMNHQS